MTLTKKWQKRRLNKEAKQTAKGKTVEKSGGAKVGKRG